MDERIEIKLARLEEKSEHIISKLDDTRDNIGKIFTKLDELPCATHTEKIKGLISQMNYLYWVFAIVVICGIVLGIWMRNGMAK